MMDKLLWHIFFNALQDLDHLEKMQNTTKVSYQAEALVFARLCPFVALRVVPEKMFWFPSCSDERVSAFKLVYIHVRQSLNRAPW